jgi:hypothetical protein
MLIVETAEGRKALPLGELDKRYARTVNGPTRMGSGAYMVTSEDAAAGRSTIRTGFVSTITSLIVQIARSSTMVTVDACTLADGPDLVVQSGSAYVLTSGDIVYWVCFGI